MPDPVAIAGGVVATIALVYQARAYSLSRREMELKVKELSDVVARIDSETKARTALERAHEEHEVTTKLQYAEALNYTSGLEKGNRTITTALEMGLLQTSAELHSILRVVLGLLRQASSMSSNDHARLNAIEAYSGALLEHIAVGQEWQRKMDEMKEKLGPGPDRKGDAAAWDAHCQQLTIGFARLQGAYHPRVEATAEKLAKAKVVFFSALNGSSS